MSSSPTPIASVPQSLYAAMAASIIPQSLTTPSIEPEKIELKTYHQAEIGNRRSEFAFEKSGVTPFFFMGNNYHPQTREIVMWVLDQTPNAKIFEDEDTSTLRVVFDNETDATAFKIRWC